MITVSAGMNAGGVLTRYATLELLKNAVAADALLDGCDVHLAKVMPEFVTPDTLLGDITESAFSGYAKLEGVTFQPPSWEDGFAQTVSLDPPPEFRHNGGVDAESVVGVYVTKHVGMVDVLVYAERIQPKTMAIADQVINPLVALQVSADA